MVQKIIIAYGLEIRDTKQHADCLAFLKKYCSPKKNVLSVWTFPQDVIGSRITHEIQLVYTAVEFAVALNTPDIFVVYEGHSRYGQGPTFGKPQTPHVPDKQLYPVNPWGVHFRMGYDATDTECISDLLEHSVIPQEYDITNPGKNDLLPSALHEASKVAKAKQKHLETKKIKASAICSHNKSWHLYNTCLPKRANITTARGDTPLHHRHYYQQFIKIEKDPNTKQLNRKIEYATAVAVGSTDLNKSSLKCKILYMASCSSYVHFYNPLKKQRKAVKSNCLFLLNSRVSSASNAANFLEAVIKGFNPSNAHSMKRLVKILNGFSESGLVGWY